MVNEAQGAELKIAYLESVRRANHFIISSSTILFVLFSVVQLELSRAQSETKVLRREVIKFTQRLDRCIITLSHMSGRSLGGNLRVDDRLSNIWKYVNEANREIEKVQDLKKIQDQKSIQEGPQFPQFQKLDFEKKSSVNSKGIPRFSLKDEYLPNIEIPGDQIQTLVFNKEAYSELKRPIAISIKPEHLESIDSLQKQILNRLKIVSDWLEQNKKTDNPSDKLLVEPMQKLATTLNSVAADLKPYKKTYHDCLSLRDSAKKKRTELRKISKETQSLPTPFGDFNVPSKFALIALSLASILAYAMVLVSIPRIRRMVESSLDAWEGAVLLDHAPPFWLYGDGGRSVKAAFQKKHLFRGLGIANAGFHFAWLFCIAWLIHESLALKASGVLFPDNGKFADYIIIVVFLSTIVFALILYCPVFSSDKALHKSLNISRRRTLFGISAACFVAGAAYYFGTRFSGLRSKPCASEPYQRVFSSYCKEFVGNRRTKILHHVDACRNHLPKHDNRIACDASSTGFCSHAGYTGRILEKLALTEIKAKHGERAVRYLKKAIELDPLDYRPYDLLIGLYGRLQQYSEIERLLQTALAHVQQKKSQQDFEIKDQSSLKERKKVKLKIRHIQRAEREFEVRLKAAYGRARKKAER